MIEQVIRQAERICRVGYGSELANKRAIAVCFRIHVEYVATAADLGLYNGSRELFLPRHSVVVRE